MRASVSCSNCSLDRHARPDHIRNRIRHNSPYCLRSPPQCDANTRIASLRSFLRHNAERQSGGISRTFAQTETMPHPAARIAARSHRRLAPSNAQRELAGARGRFQTDTPATIAPVTPRLRSSQTRRPCRRAAQPRMAGRLHAALFCRSPFASARGQTRLDYPRSGFVGAGATVTQQLARRASRRACETPQGVWFRAPSSARADRGAGSRGIHPG